MVMKKKQFETPRVVREVRLQLETNFLGSIVKEGMFVESSGQTVTSIDASHDTDIDWNNEWKWD